MASETSKVAVRGNMHNDTRVIEVADLKFEVKFKLWGLWGHFEATMASEATKLSILGNMQIDSKVIEHHMPISHSPCGRRSKGPLPSCSGIGPLKQLHNSILPIALRFSSVTSDLKWASLIVLLTPNLWLADVYMRRREQLPRIDQHGHIQSREKVLVRGCDKFFPALA